MRRISGCLTNLLLWAGTVERMQLSGTMYGGYTSNSDSLLAFRLLEWRQPFAISQHLTRPQLSYKMSYMREVSISIRELHRNLKRVMARVERGQVIEVTRRRRPIARLAPLSSGPGSPWPDLDERVRAVFGDRVVTPGPSTIVLENRGDR
jgi:prevent-host-death family protein